MSIRLKLIIMFLAITSIPVILVGALTFHNYKNSMEIKQISHLKDIAAYKADKIETYFNGLKSNIKITPGFYNIRKNLPVLLRLSEDPNNPEFQASKEQLGEQLQLTQSVLSDVTDIMLVNPEGKVVYANKSGHLSKDLTKGSSEAERRAFAEGKDKVYLSDIYFDKAEDNRYEMLLTAPAFDFNNVPIGIIAFEVDMTTVYKLVQDKTGLGETGESVMGKKVANEVLYLSPLRYEPNAALNKKITIGAGVAVPIQNAAQGKTGASITADYRGKKVIGAWTYLPSQGWGLATKIDADEALADVTNLRNLILLILVIILILSGITAFSIAQSISTPIKRLTEGAAIVGSGNLDYQIGTNSKDEIGQLSRTFDKMTFDLKHTLASRDELSTEVAARKKKEQELQSLNRTLKALSKSAQVIMQSSDESEYLQKVCDIIINDCGHAMVWIGFAENDEDKSVRPVAYSGFEKGYLETLKLTWADTQRGRGPTGMAIRTGQVSFCKNMLTDPAFEPWRKEALKRGYKSSIVLPLMDKDRAFGALNIYSKEPDPFSPDEVSLLTELTNDLAFGILSIRLRIARDKAEETLTRMSELLSESQKIAHLGSFEYVVDTRTTVWSEEEFRIYGLDPSGPSPAYDVMIAKHIHPDDAGLLNETFGVAMQNGSIYELEHRIVHPDGSVHFVYDRAYPYFDANGRLIRYIGATLDITERKKAEDTLRQMNKRLDMAQTAAQAGVWDWDITTGCLEWSPQMFALFRLDPNKETASFDLWKKILHPEDMEIAGLRIEQALKEHTTLNSDYRIILPNGQVRWINAVGDGQYDLKGQPVRMLGICVDITERKQAEEAVSTSRAKLATAFASITEAIFIADVGGRLTDFNDEFIRYHRFKDRDECSRTIADCPKYLEAYFADGTPAPPEQWAMTRALRGETASNVEYQLRRKETGEMWWGSYSFAPIKDKDGGITGAIVSAREITTLKQAEEAIRNSEAKYRELVQSANSVIIRWKKDGTIVFFNEYAQSLFGYSADEVIGKNVGILVPETESTGQDLTGLAQDIVNHPENYVNNVNENVCHNGRRIWMAWTNKPILDTNGQVVEILAVGTDITNLKEAEDKIREVATRFEILSDTASKLLENKNPQQIVNSLCSRVMEHLDCHVFINYLVDEQAHRLHLNASGGLPKKTAGDIEWLDFGQAICGRVAQEGKRIVAENIQESCDARADIVRSFGIKAYACHPIMTQGKVIGTLSFGTRSRTSYDADDLAMMKTVTDQVASAMERKRVEDALKKSHDELEMRVEERTKELTEEIAERKKAEDALRSVSLYSRSLLEASLDPLLTISAEGKITDVNEATIKVTGIERRQLIGTDFSDYFTEPDKAKIGYQQVFAQGFVTDYPLTVRHRNGRLTDVLYNATVYKNQEGKVQGIFAAARDVTVQKQASQYARSLIEASLDPLVTISAKGKITDVNEATVKVTGVPREKLIGTDFSDYFTEPQKAENGYHQVFDRGYVTDYPLTIRHQDGHLTDVLYNATVYNDTHGNVAGVFAAARDITEKKIIEAELEKHRRNLEDLVKQRTDALVRSNKDLEQFAYVASHDLQEPLRAVGGFVSLLHHQLENNLNEKTKEYMDFAMDGVARMQNLINGLLEYSRIDTRGKPPQKTDSKKLLQEALLDLQTSIKESGALIIDGVLPIVNIDPLQLKQLFANLISNAIKFRGDRTPEIHITAVRQDNIWQFAVKDNGIGIEPQYAERIFLIFQRLHTRKKYPGTGIGLSLCKKIVERHGGKIWVESEPGHGSTFYFTIPDIAEA
jgi:PAS domain S-box-containing protein